MKVSEIYILLKFLRHLIPTISNGHNQSPTHKHDRLKKSACEEIISILLYFLQNGIHTSEYNLHSIQYLIYHPDYLILTSQPLDQRLYEKTSTLYYHLRRRFNPILDKTSRCRSFNQCSDKTSTHRSFNHIPGQNFYSH